MHESVQQDAWFGDQAWFKLEEKTQHLEPNEKFIVLQGTSDHGTIFQRRAGNSSSEVLRKCWEASL